MKKSNAALDRLHRLGRVEIRRHRGPAGHRHRDDLAIRRGVLVSLDVVLPGADRGDVGRDPRRRLEPPGPDVVVGVERLRRRRVGEHLPVHRSGDRELERRLEIRLLEIREHPPRVRHLEVRVEVDPAVRRVDAAVQALAGVGVGAIGDHPDRVLRGQVVERDAMVAIDLVGVESPAVQRDRVDTRRDQVQEGGCAGLGGGEMIVVSERNVSAPAGSTRKSRSTSYAEIVTSSLRRRASSRVRFVPGIP